MLPSCLNPSSAFALCYLGYCVFASSLAVPLLVWALCVLVAEMRARFRKTGVTSSGILSRAEYKGTGRMGFI